MGQTPLHYAVIRAVNAGVTPYDAIESRAEARAGIETLIAAGANVDARDERGDTALHLAAQHSYSGRYYLSHADHAIEALLDAGANATARNAAGRTPWDFAQANESLSGSDAYWRLNEARFDTPMQDSRRPTATQPNSQQSAAPQRDGPGCEIPGYPAPANLRSIGLNWCTSSVDFQRRVFALQVAGAWCAIAEGTSSSPEQVAARHTEINVACDTLDALAARDGARCQCPADYRP